MSTSEKTTSPIKATGYVPEIDPNTASLEEFEDWIIALGGRRLTPEEGREIVRSTIWPDVPGENPGDPDFPLAARL